MPIISKFSTNLMIFIFCASYSVEAKENKQKAPPKGKVSVVRGEQSQTKIIEQRKTETPTQIDPEKLPPEAKQAYLDLKKQDETRKEYLEAETKRAQALEKNKNAMPPGIDGKPYDASMYSNPQKK